MLGWHKYITRVMGARGGQGQAVADTIYKDNKCH